MLTYLPFGVAVSSGPSGAAELLDIEPILLSLIFWAPTILMAAAAWIGFAIGSSRKEFREAIKAKERERR